MKKRVIHPVSLSTVLLLTFASTVFAQHDETGYQLPEGTDTGYGYEPPEADYNSRQGFGDFPPSDIDERLNGQIVEYTERDSTPDRKADGKTAGDQAKAGSPATTKNTAGASQQAIPKPQPYAPADAQGTFPQQQGAYPQQGTYPQPQQGIYSQQGAYLQQRAFPQRAFPQAADPQNTYPQATAQGGFGQGGATRGPTGMPQQGAASPSAQPASPATAPQSPYPVYPQNMYPQNAYPPAAYPPAAAYPQYPGRNFGGSRYGHSNSFTPWGGSGPDFGGSGPWDSRGSGFDMPWGNDRHGSKRGRGGPWGMDDWMDPDVGGFSFNP